MHLRNFHAMPSLKIFVLFGVVFGPTIIQGQQCADKSRYCSQWPDSYCTTFRVYMKANCPKKCGYCTTECSDKQSQSNCVHWKNSGYCANDGHRYQSYMKENCKKTCRLCAVSCPKLNVSKAVHANISGYQYGSTAKFSCKHADYVLSDKDFISCKENGEWSGKVPECLAPCHVNASDNLISKKIYHHGTKADLKCEDGFTLDGTINGKMPVCSNGTWKFESARFPYCVENGKIAKAVEGFWSTLKKLAARKLG